MTILTLQWQNCFTSLQKQYLSCRRAGIRLLKEIQSQTQKNVIVFIAVISKLIFCFSIHPTQITHGCHRQNCCEFGSCKNMRQICCCKVAFVAAKLIYQGKVDCLAAKLSCSKVYSVAAELVVLLQSWFCCCEVDFIAAKLILSLQSWLCRFCHCKVDFIAAELILLLEKCLLFLQLKVKLSLLSTLFQLQMCTLQQQNFAATTYKLLQQLPMILHRDCEWVGFVSGWWLLWHQSIGIHMKAAASLWKRKQTIRMQHQLLLHAMAVLVMDMIVKFSRLHDGNVMWWKISLWDLV